ncbi:hypothetical protein D9M69_582640 [compost metagenome]
MKPASTTSAGAWASTASASAASKASRLSKAWCGTTAVAMPCDAASAKPPASALLLMTAAMRAPKRSAQRSRSAARTMAAMFEPPPEIRITMFFMGGRDYPCPANTPISLPSTRTLACLSRRGHRIAARPC